jgi:hypothetical protein
VTDDSFHELVRELPVVACPPAVAKRVLTELASPPRRARIRWWAWAAPLAAAAVLAAALVATRPDPTPQYTPAEVTAARSQAITSLTTAMSLIERTQREAVTEVLGRQVSGTLRASVQKALQLSEGGQG